MFNPLPTLGAQWGNYSHVFMHMLKVNLNGMGVGDTLLAYAGSVLDVEKVHILVLFEQTGTLQVDTSDYASQCPLNAMAKYGNQRQNFILQYF